MRGELENALVEWKKQHVLWDQAHRTLLEAERVYKDANGRLDKAAEAVGEAARHRFTGMERFLQLGKDLYRVLWINQHPRVAV